MCYFSDPSMEANCGGYFCYFLGSCENEADVKNRREKNVLTFNYEGVVTVSMTVTPKKKNVQAAASLSLMTIVCVLHCSNGFLRICELERLLRDISLRKLTSG